MSYLQDNTISVPDRFRFRWWDNYDEQYYYDVQNLSEPDCFGSGTDTEYTEHGDADDFGELLKLQAKDYGVIEQCTGLKDKNGKLIYEGDILATSPNSQSYGCYKVFFQKDECSFKVISCDGSHDYAIPLNVLTEKNDFQIIGNIHENPELLK